MPRPWSPTGRVPLALLGAALFLLPTSAPLAGTGNPVPAACDQEDSGERIKCKTQNVLDQQAASVDMMRQFPGMSDAQMQRLNKHVGRARNSESRTPGRDFKDLTKKRAEKCRIVPLDPNDGDGVCTGNEACKEVIGDGIGDDDGTCKTRGKPSEREVCEEVCDQDAITDPRNFDDDPEESGSLGADVEQGLDDATAEYVEFNGNLEQENLRLASIRALAGSSTAGAAADACSAALESRANENLVFGAITASTTLETIANQFNPVCQLDVAGFNSAPVCIIFETLAGIAKIITNGFVFEDGNVSSKHIDQTFECVKSLDAANEAVQGDLEVVKNDLATVKSELSAVQGKLDDLQQALATTLELLKTPQGQREGFPTK
jgi:hypothetical protein